MLQVESLPRTICFLRADGSDLPIPAGYPYLKILDQTKLPEQIEYVYLTDWREVIDAIRTLKVRGAPAIGIAGAAALALRAQEFCFGRSERPQDEYDMDRVFVIDTDSFDPELYLTSLSYCADMIRSARPTAVNLARMVDAGMDIVNEEVSGKSSASVIADRLFEFVAQSIIDDENINRSIGTFGSELLPENATVLTHCNAGSLATAFYGTALGVVYTACDRGGIARVYADETRPVNQGSRLTVWELSRAGVPVTLICDDMAASVLSSKGIDAVVVGADRIAANGDVANKIGTLGLAVLADHFKIPFYVASPTSSVDLATAKGSDIVIEERSAEEVLSHPMDGVDVYNPAFDVTPASLVTKIITENGVFDPAHIADALRAQEK